MHYGVLIRNIFVYNFLEGIILLSALNLSFSKKIDYRILLHALLFGTYNLFIQLIFEYMNTYVSQVGFNFSLIITLIIAWFNLILYYLIFIDADVDCSKLFSCSWLITATYILITDIFIIIYMNIMDSNITELTKTLESELIINLGSKAIQALIPMNIFFFRRNKNEKHYQQISKSS